MGSLVVGGNKKTQRIKLILPISAPRNLIRGYYTVMIHEFRQLAKTFFTAGFRDIHASFYAVLLGSVECADSNPGPTASHCRINYRKIISYSLRCKAPTPSPAPSVPPSSSGEASGGGSAACCGSCCPRPLHPRVFGGKWFGGKHFSGKCSIDGKCSIGGKCTVTQRRAIPEPPTICTEPGQST